ncbi:MAG: hypothetical protein D3903_20450 [Candidatus Electrothrix sp. GM3_4]|nr:hypothetical protein [Candidatus Electrothrix sp. GM3_4]
MGTLDHSQNYYFSTPFYGPDNKMATKVAVGIMMGEVEKEPADMKKWFSDTDIRQDTKILNEIKKYITEHGVRSVVMANKILGCPHEEEIDYPLGESCPECPYWADRDRVTDELIH